MKDDSIIYQDRHAWLVAILDNFTTAIAFPLPSSLRSVGEEDRGTR